MNKTKIARLATVKSNGEPHVVPVWFYYDGAAAFIGTGENSVKVKNVKENGKVALAVDSGENYQDIRGILLEGRAVIVGRVNPDPKDADMLYFMNSIASKFITKYFGSAEHPTAKQIMERQRKEGVIIKIIPDKIHSWDYSKQ